ncbi:hypothetical protein, partial [Winogradskyella psychrotolerans]|uniref:hypothetical protein n=1 Tax=Winogradskyella psychrotolerans TaxID=1344585 RepID=UPI001C07B75B
TKETRCTSFKQHNLRAIKLLILILLISLTSCYSTKRLIRKNDYKMSEFNKQKLSGIYNNGLNDSLPQNLWATLKSSDSDKTHTRNHENNNVKLTLVDNENINVKLLNETDDNVIDEFNLKGRIKGDFFTIDRKLTLYPFVPIYYINKETKTIIGNDLNGNLVVVTGRVSEGMILMMASGNRNVQNSQFKRIKN